MGVAGRYWGGATAGGALSVVPSRKEGRVWLEPPGHEMAGETGAKGAASVRRALAWAAMRARDRVEVNLELVAEVMSLEGRSPSGLES